MLRSSINRVVSSGKRSLGLFAQPPKNIRRLGALAPTHTPSDFGRFLEKQCEGTQVDGITLKEWTEAFEGIITPFDQLQRDIQFFLDSEVPQITDQNEAKICEAISKKVLFDLSNKNEINLLNYTQSFTPNHPLSYKPFYFIVRSQEQLQTLRSIRTVTLEDGWRTLYEQSLYCKKILSSLNRIAGKTLSGHAEVIIDAVAQIANSRHPAQMIDLLGYEENEKLNNAVFTWKKQMEVLGYTSLEEPQTPLMQVLYNVTIFADRLSRDALKCYQSPEDCSVKFNI